MRLEPVILGPPPAPGQGQPVAIYPSAPSVSADDDLDPSELNGPGRTGLIVGVVSAMLVLATAGAAYLTLGREGLREAQAPPSIAPAAPPAPAQSPEPATAPSAPPPAQASAPPPEPVAPQAALRPPDPPSSPPDPPERIEPPPQVSVPPPPPRPVQEPAAPVIDMGRVDSELVPPSTEGLSPPRRIQTIRIVVENDRELLPNR